MPFQKSSDSRWTGQKYRQNNRHVLFDMYRSFVMTYILRHFAFWREPEHVIIRLSLIFLFKSCLPWYWSKMTTVNSLIVTTFRKRPPPVSDHFKNNRFVSQSNTVSNTTSKLALFQIGCYSHARYHKQFSTTKYFTLIQNYWSSKRVWHWIPVEGLIITKLNFQDWINKENHFQDWGSKYGIAYLCVLEN